MPKPTRKGSTPAKVYCLPSELEELKGLADAAGLTVSTYLLRVGLRYRVKGVLDYRYVEELIRINADLGRLGGLLKLWLTDDPRTAKFGADTIRAVLTKIEDTQSEMQEVITYVVLPSTRRKSHLNR
ncbi:MAG: conjugal transfer transcriptional regulator TraJ [Pseudomonadota bacterium]